MKICNQAHARKSNFLGLSFNEKYEVFRKQQTYMHFGRIKTFFFLKSLSNIQIFQSLLHLCRLSFSNCVSCRRHYEEVKNTSNALGPSAVTLKMGIGIKRPFLPWKFIENEQKLWYLKGKRHFVLRRTSVWLR